jgi:hypothetical protein
MFFKRTICCILLATTIFQCNLFAQSDASLFYIDFTGGVTIGEISGFTYNTAANYRINKNIFTFRTLYTLGENSDTKDNKISIFPFFNGEDTINEYAFLYGRVLISNPSNLTISMGISSNLYKYKAIENGLIVNKRESYIGFPFEVNINTIKIEKKGFQVLFGAKLYGNISQATYVGLGFNIGLGW